MTEQSTTDAPRNRSAAAEVEQLARADWGRLLSALIADIGDFQLAEECLQDALESALIHWGRNGLPRRPRAWALQVARRRAIDRIRRDRTFRGKRAEYQYLLELDAASPADMDEQASPIPDERLRLIFTCCHPALKPTARVALTLRTLCGLTTREIARAFLVSETTMAQRLVRAKQKIARAGIPYRVPDTDHWPERLNSVLTVIYLIFNEGYSATSGKSSHRQSLTDEAMRLARILLRLRPDEPEVMGLLALMLLHQSRFDARMDANGATTPLAVQDRSLWRQDLIDEGISLVENALVIRRHGPYQFQAAISAVHAEATDHASTDWPQIVMLYEHLHRLSPGPVVLLNWAVAVSFARDPGKALPMLETCREALADYQPWYAARADILRRAGHPVEARAAYKEAIARAGTDADAMFLQKQLADLSVVG